MGIKPPENITELRRFLGMTNQLSKFSPHLAEQTKPLRDLLSSKNLYAWGDDQDRAFNKIKATLSWSEILARYDATRETILSADASFYGIGAVLRQRQQNGDQRPISYISRALTDTEQRYAQIEKEALGITWYAIPYWKTDHKILIPLFSSKPLNELPIQV